MALNITREQVTALSNVVYRLEDQDYAQVKRFRDIERKARLIKELGVSEEQRVLLSEIIALAEEGRHDEKNDEHNHGLLAAIVAKMKELFKQ